MTDAATSNVKFTAVLKTTTIDLLASERKLYSDAVADALSTEGSAVSTKQHATAPHEVEVETTITVENEMVTSVVSKVTRENINTSLAKFMPTATVEKIGDVATVINPLGGVMSPTGLALLIIGAVLLLILTFVGYRERKSAAVKNHFTHAHAMV